MKNIKNITTALSLIFITSCSPKIMYMGNDAGQTANIQVFYGEAPSDRTYDVLGIATNEVSKGDMRQNKLNKIQDAMIAKAKKKGADAVVFTSLRKENVGSRGTVNNNNGVTISVGRLNNNASNNNTSTVNSYDQKKNVIEAKFIKFK